MGEREQPFGERLQVRLEAIELEARIAPAGRQVLAVRIESDDLKLEAAYLHQDDGTVLWVREADNDRGWLDDDEPTTWRYASFRSLEEAFAATSEPWMGGEEHPEISLEWLGDRNGLEQLLVRARAAPIGFRWNLQAFAFDGQILMNKELLFPGRDARPSDALRPVWSFIADVDSGGPVSWRISEMIGESEGMYFFVDESDSGDHELRYIGRFENDALAVEQGKGLSRYSDDDREAIYMRSEQYEESERWRALERIDWDSVIERFDQFGCEVVTDASRMLHGNGRCLRALQTQPLRFGWRPLCDLRYQAWCPTCLRDARALVDLVDQARTDWWGSDESDGAEEAQDVLYRLPEGRASVGCNLFMRLLGAASTEMGDDGHSWSRARAQAPLIDVVMLYQQWCIDAGAGLQVRIPAPRDDDPSL